MDLPEKHHNGTATPASSDVDKTIINENTALQNLGYTPELKRSFSTPGIIAFSFSIVTCWTALSGVLIVGVSSGGPPVMVWSWLGVCIFTLAVAYSMAEMCSAYPVAGGQYSWVAVFAPKSLRRGMSYVCGWFMLIGILAMGATNNFITANFILGLAVLNNPSYVIERWHTALAAWAVGVFTLAVNVFVPKLLDKISKGLLIWNICSFVIVIVTMLATNDNRQSASFVFSDFVNFSGFNPAYTAIYGLLQTAFGMCCYDAPSHMTEVRLLPFPPFHPPNSPTNPPSPAGNQARPPPSPARHHPLRLPRRRDGLHLPHRRLLQHGQHRRDGLDPDARAHDRHPAELHALRRRHQLPHRPLHRHLPRRRQRADGRGRPRRLCVCERSRLALLGRLEPGGEETLRARVRPLPDRRRAARARQHLLRHGDGLQHGHFHRHGGVLCVIPFPLPPSSPHTPG